MIRHIDYMPNRFKCFIADGEDFPEKITLVRAKSLKNTLKNVLRQLKFNHSHPYSCSVKKKNNI